MAITDENCSHGVSLSPKLFQISRSLFITWQVGPHRGEFESGTIPVRLCVLILFVRIGALSGGVIFFAW